MGRNSSNMGFAKPVPMEIKEENNIGIISIRYHSKDDLGDNKTLGLRGLEIPKPNQILVSDKGALAWMSTDEFWFIVKKNQVKKTLKDLLKEYDNKNSIAIDISASRSVLSIKGALWRNVIAKGCPADLSDSSFRPGNIRRTRLGLVSVAIWCQNIDHAFVVCNRSVKDYLLDWVGSASLEGTIPEFY